MTPTFGEMVRAARKRSGLTGLKFAERIGVQQSTLSRYENDQYKEAPPPGVVAAIVREFGVPELDLVRGLGYLSTVPVAEAVSPFPPDSPAARVVELMRNLTDKEIGPILTVAEAMAGHIEHIRAARDDGPAVKRPAG